MKNIPYFPTVKDFEEYYNEWLDERTPARKVVKPGRTEFKLTKRKTVKEAVKELRMDANGIPYEEVISKKQTREVPDTNTFTKLIIAYLESAWGCKSVRRISSEGRWRPNKNHPKGGIWIPGQNTGIEDVQAVIEGRIVSVEIKFTKTDRMREAQLERQQQVEADGGVYIIARSLAQFQDELKKRLK